MQYTGSTTRIAIDAIEFFYFICNVCSNLYDSTNHLKIKTCCGNLPRGLNLVSLIVC